MAELDQLNVSTDRYVRKTPELMDLIFENDPCLAYLKANCSTPFTGGTSIDESFWYQGLIGGPYLKGKTFNITERQVEQRCAFYPKFFEINVTLSKEDVQVINKGPAAAFSIVDSRMRNGYSTMGAHQSLALYLNGVNANYTPNWVGLPEALNDNSTASWDGNTYANYGTIPRGGNVGAVLNSAPVNVGGALEYPTMEEHYGASTHGTKEPNVGSTTVIGYHLFKEKFQTQQRFVDTVDPVIGLRGMKFNAATLMKSRYCPGSYLFGSSGTADPIAVTFMTEMTGGALTAYPIPAGYTSGTWETLWWLTLQRPFANFYVTDDPEFGYGWTGFKPGQGNTLIAGQILFSGAVTFAPKFHKQLYGITG